MAGERGVAVLRAHAKQITVLQFLFVAVILIPVNNAVAAADPMVGDTDMTLITGSSGHLLGPPQTSDLPVIVWTEFHLRDIYDVHDREETFDFSGVLTLTWQDDRQAFDPTETGFAEKVFQSDYQFNETFVGWFPQILLTNEAGSYQQRGIVLRIQPNGILTLIATIFATGKTELQLRRYPFDRQQLKAVFEVVGFDTGEVVLQTAPEAADPSYDRIRIPHWRLDTVRVSTRDITASYAGKRGVASGFIVSMEIQRNPLFTLRLIVLPLVIIVMLSWSVFWMDKSSVGDRAAVSFVGILTAVTFMILIGDQLPQISYLTWLNALLNLSFIVMSATVVINLVVGYMDKTDNHKLGNRIDHACRWAFPLVYFGLALSSLSIAFIFF